MSRAKLKSWTQIAKDAARVVHRDHHATHRDVFLLNVDGFDGPDRVVVIDNHPWSDNSTRRDRTFAVLSESLKQQGIKVLARASYPTTGEDAGYTVALVTDSSDPAVVEDAFRVALDWTAKDCEPLFRRIGPDPKRAADNWADKNLPPFLN